MIGITKQAKQRAVSNGLYLAKVCIIGKHLSRADFEMSGAISENIRIKLHNLLNEWTQEACAMSQTKEKE